MMEPNLWRLKFIRPKSENAAHIVHLHFLCNQRFQVIYFLKPLDQMMTLS
jgi:hypothetical protein